MVQGAVHIGLQAGGLPGHAMHLQLYLVQLQRLAPPANRIGVPLVGQGKSSQGIADIDFGPDFRRQDIDPFRQLRLGPFRQQIGD